MRQKFFALSTWFLLKVLEEQQFTLFSCIANLTKPHTIEIGGARNKEESHICGRIPLIKALVLRCTKIYRLFLNLSAGYVRVTISPAAIQECKNVWTENQICKSVSLNIFLVVHVFHCGLKSLMLYEVPIG